MVYPAKRTTHLKIEVGKSIKYTEELQVVQPGPMLTVTEHQRMRQETK